MKTTWKLILTELLLATVLLGAYVIPVHAQVIYQQKKLMLTDEEGDRVLLQLFLDTCETGIKKCVQRENVAPQESQYRVPRFARENPLVPNSHQRITDNSRLLPLFDSETLLTNFQRIIQQEAKRGNNLSIGDFHTWKISPRFALSKIVVALATASSARFLYVGQEPALIAWIKNQPDNSVTPEMLFRQSYLLNKGNIYLTILTIENILSDATFEERREDTLVNHKLTDLYAYSPNKFGDWYHFFGTMLAGYVQEPAKIIAEMYSVYRKISRGENAEKSTMDADKSGAQLGGALRQFAEKESYGPLRYWIKQLIRARVSSVHAGEH